MWSFFIFYWMWIFPWIKLSWYSGSMWDKLGWLSWFWQFLSDGLSSFNLKWLCYSYASSCSLCQRRNFFSAVCILENSMDSYLCFWLALLHSVLSEIKCPGMGHFVKSALFEKNCFFSIRIRCIKNILIRGIKPPLALLNCSSAIF